MIASGNGKARQITRQGLCEKDGHPSWSSSSLEKQRPMRISIVIPTYNRAHCIGRALESVRAQGNLDPEVIIADDASTDETLQVVDRVMPSARIVRLPFNRGAAAARNEALKVVGGDLIALLDSDDEWLPGKLERQMNYLQNNPEISVCASGHRLICRDGSEIDFPGRNPTDWRRALQSAQSFHGASTPLIRREVLDKIGPLDDRLRVLEDWDWMLRISGRFGVHVLPEMLSVIHENNPSDPDQTLLSTELFLQKHHSEFLDYGPRHAARVISQHYENAARNLFRHDRAGDGRRMLWKSVTTAPLRNPVSVVAFPLAGIDSVLGTKFLSGVLAWRNRRPLGNS